jgi:hypothetical protein
MGSWLQTALVVGSLLAATSAFIWLAIRQGKGANSSQPEMDFSKMAEKDIEHIFNDEFREELRNRGRLHFEKIIGENAMFLQQDLRLTTSQVNDYMKQEITKTLQEAFSKYQESINDAEKLALESIQKTQDTVEKQRQLMSQQLEGEISKEKARLTELFGNRMADIVNHYVLAAIGNQISLEDQLEFIMAELDRNKAAIIEDIEQGT